MSAIMMPQPGGATRLSYVDYMNQLTELNRQEPITPAAGWLYVVLLGFFNDRRKYNVWPATVQFADPFLCMATGISAPNTFKKHRAELVARGLIGGDFGHQGAGKKGTYWLLQVAENTAENAAEKPSLKLSNNDSLIDGLSYAEREKLSEKLSAKLSTIDTNYKKEEIKEDVTTEGPAGIEKKIAEHVFGLPDPEEIAAQREAAAGAPHTGGGAALQPAQPGELLRGGFVDPRLSDDDPRKWEARPKNAEMVNEYLAGHPDPEVSKHAGKGQLLIDYYEQYDWCAGKDGKPIRNWRAVARQFSFINYKAKREAEAAAAGGSQVEQRQSSVSGARELLKAQRAQKPS